VQTYLYTPGVPNTWENVSPGSSAPESHKPSRSLVVVWRRRLAAFSQVTVSPRLMVIFCGRKK
jgi:hypothetical protein